TLTTQMKSVGETMAIGRTFKESVQKALRGLETGRFGLGCDRADRWGTPSQPSVDEIVAKLATPTAERIWYVRYAFKAGMTVEDVFARTKIDRWFLNNLLDIVGMEDRLRSALPHGDGAEALDRVPTDLLLQAKQYGFSDMQLATLWHTSQFEVRRLRQERG